MRLATLAWLTVLLFFGAARADEPAAREAQKPATGFLYKMLELEGRRFPYCVYVPPEYSAERPWPTILFLHGSGECGEDGLLQTEVGIGRAIRINRQRIPAIVIMPQLPRDFQRTTGWLPPMASMATKCVEQTSREYHLDADRIYLTGLSLGGHGVWHLAAALPDRFAAIAPICGFAELGQPTGMAERLAPRLVNVPTWCFHGDMDDRVPVQKSRELIEAIRRAGGRPFYTEVRGGNHFIWDRVYEDHDFWRWLLEQKRGRPASGAPATPADSAPAKP